MHDAAKEILETLVPARLDRLPWGRFHTLVAVALGITWVLDGLEVTLAGSIAGALEVELPPAFQRVRHRLSIELLSYGRCRRRAWVWMDDRPARPQAAVLCHLRSLFNIHDRYRF